MIEQKVLTLIENQFGREPGSILITDHLIKDLGGDSVDVLEVAMILETEFNIEITSEETSEAMIIGDLVNLVNTKCQ
jgi:acyl carrier protein